VDSTKVASEVGDSRWKELVEEHHAIVRTLLSRYRGDEIDIAGDGFFATFDGPARAIRCGIAIIGAVEVLGLRVRVGIHTGEVTTIAGKAGGYAVALGARIGGTAKPSEVLVSQTVRDLVAGSGLTFVDRGQHRLKGIGDTWHLFAVAK
jgi:class 3 adenylate cyclase